MPVQSHGNFVTITHCCWASYSPTALASQRAVKNTHNRPISSAGSIPSHQLTVYSRCHFAVLILIIHQLQDRTVLQAYKHVLVPRILSAVHPGPTLHWYPVVANYRTELNWTELKKPSSVTATVNVIVVREGLKGSTPRLLANPLSHHV